MPLKTLLAEILQHIPGSLGAVLVDWEGEAVEHVSHMDAFELKLLGAHQGIILESLRRVAQRLDGSDIDEVVVHARRLNILIAPVTGEYFLVLTLDRGALTPRARAVVRNHAQRLRREIC
ncbi:roadblock/LC7 domain-containing protein [Geoalkalibacter halelectricus]|uniref:Roadblock/LC7 domain-containing protein n=1 Tax=Geoalkalibacter halelectricus TaxID=2847045 RepID=A0ABY5ZP76_9BACT|nr:roadblock/LC7 domain-containing protein [Geoalkalibacter halelectricus]MDO3379193.1 roadblock/LC7 domain-containing protein [Geoalkalibacter halelectricus]UWZ80952.1 roadblock/LC7 domain-containing protein [Geoalkalibacter halelectricus]